MQPARCSRRLTWRIALLAETISTESEPSWSVHFHRSSAKRLARLLLSVLLILLPSSAAWPQEVSRDAPKREQQPAQQSGTPRQTTSSNAAAVEGEVTPPGHVVIEGRHVVTVHEPVGNLTPEDRATGIERRILALAKDSGVSADSVCVQSREGMDRDFMCKPGGHSRGRQNGGQTAAAARHGRCREHSSGPPQLSARAQLRAAGQFTGWSDRCGAREQAPVHQIQLWPGRLYPLWRRLPERFISMAVFLAGSAKIDNAALAPRNSVRSG
jgi:hypothetical protein